MKGILGRKIGMTEVFTKNGKLIPVTVVEVTPNVVTQVKTTEKDGYDSIQLAFCDKKEKNASKASIGHTKKANTTPKRFLKEIRNMEGAYTVGDQIGANLFAAGEAIDVTGTSKGKGFQGVIKRYNQTRGPMTHGSRYHRGPGSLGTMRPMRVFKAKKLPGHMGSETVTIQNLEIIEINANENYILVSGNIPGPKNGLVLIRSAAKTTKNNTPAELVNYDEETVTDEVIEEVITEETSSEAIEDATEAVEEEPIQEETTEESTVEATAEEGAGE